MSGTRDGQQGEIEALKAEVARLTEELRLQKERSQRETRRISNSKISPVRKPIRDPQVLSHILDTVPQAVFWKDRNSVYLGCNKAFARSVGFDDPEDLVGKTDYDLPSPRDLADAYRADDREVIRNNRPKIHIIEPFRMPDGSPAWLDTTKLPIHDRHGDVIGILGVYENITERQQTEIALQQSEQRLRTLISNLPGAVYRRRADQTAHLEFVSHGIQDLTGYTAERLLAGNPPFDKLVHPDDRARIREAYRHAIQTHQPFEISYRIRTAGGGERWIWERGRGVFDAAGQIQSIEGLNIDISDRKIMEVERESLEEQLYLSQKMEAIGQLAGGVAHEFNNVLMAIMGYCDLIREHLSADDPLRVEVGQITKSTARAADLTRQLLAFSRKQTMDVMVLDLNTVVSDMNRMLQRLLGEQIALHTHLAEKNTCVRADPGQIEQVLMNLAVNARDAMPEGGQLSIETARVELDATYASRHIAVAPGHYVMLAVTDTGIGMDEATRARIFDPFFTTKGVGKGTGLGLSTVYGIVKQSEGNIWCYSEPGKGTTFKVYLPFVSEQVREQRATQPAGEPPRGSETVLVAEDEEDIRFLLTSALERSGYTVLAAANGEEAQNLCKIHSGNIDLLITDLVMPDMDGKRLVDTLSAQIPSLRAIFMSGYPDQAATHHHGLYEGAPFLQKPFTFDALTRIVREVLDR